MSPPRDIASCLLAIGAAAGVIGIGLAIAGNGPMALLANALAMAAIASSIALDLRGQR